MPDLLIIAAGKGSRLDVRYPKALIRVNGVPCLSRNLENVEGLFGNIYIAYNEDVKEQWLNYVVGSNLPCWAAKEGEGKAHLVPIKSGLGDGHAVMTLLDKLPFLADEVVVMWGDVVLESPDIVTELMEIIGKEKHYAASVIPAKWEKNPYVALISRECRCAGVNFSKLAEKVDVGYHDQSLFGFNTHRLRDGLHQLHNSLWKFDHYITINRELSLLYMFNYLYNDNPETAAIIYETQYKTLTFNTLTELKVIEEILDSKHD